MNEKEQLLKEIKDLREVKHKLAFELDDIVINSLDENELKKLIDNNKIDVKIIKEKLKNPEELKKFIEGYKLLLSM